MSWEKVRLGDIFEIARGGSPRPIQSFLTNDENGVNWIMISDTKEGGKYIERTAKKIKLEGISNSRMVNEGDFLLTNSMSFGRPYILKTSGCIHDGWLVLSPKNKNIHRDYFYYYLGSDEIKQKLSSKAAGAVVKNLNKEIVSNLVIELPPLATQKRIAEILDAADALRRKDQELLKKYDELAQAIFVDMFGDPVKNEKGWVKCFLKDLVEVKGGKRLPLGSDFSDIQTAYPYIRVKDFENQSVNLTNLKYIPAETHRKISRYIINAGDVYISIAGTIGLCGTVPKVLDGANLTENAAKLVIRDKKLLTPDYLSSFLMSPYSQAEIAKRTMAVGVPKLAIFRIEELDILLPPLDIQNNYVDKLKKLSELKVQTKVSQQQSESLFSSLISNSFTSPQT